ncbi:hypothetical protein MTR67_050379 [Solanum verrucosum]|uniref:Uncharacterized protein n=1 Tax=Solanum verrucosum TaxID=315347 RepID=A0AAF0V4D7_SOLVR|nr:hypothetical protein MTR67_050379 [Solanum verrucosum]
MSPRLDRCAIGSRGRHGGPHFQEICCPCNLLEPSNVQEIVVTSRGRVRFY